MRDYYVDEFLLIMPATSGTGVRLCGEVYAAHSGPLALAVTRASHSAPTNEITVDLTGVGYLANSALETLIALARQLHPPQHLLVRAAPALGLAERLADRGWERLETLRLVGDCPEADGTSIAS